MADDLRSQERLALRNILPRIRAAWCKRTASPGGALHWTPSNPSIGQSAVTACLVQDLLGGEIIRTIVPGFGLHYYNRLPSGDILDLTADQFPEGTEIFEGEPIDHSYVLDSLSAINMRELERYELLKERYVVCRPKF